GRLLESLGHRVEANSPAVLDDPAYVERFIGMIAANIANTRDFFEAQLGREMTDADLEGDNLLFSAIGRSMGASAYLDVLAWLSSWSRRLLQWWHGPDAFDVLVCPVLTLTPPRIGWLSGPESGQRIQQLMLYTSHFNISGQPAISLPLHWSADGLPVGVQLIAAYGREDLLIRLAAQLETAQPWATRRPPVCATERSGGES
ncbi:MAG TPA: amidase family protein, partial [Ilumatobacteraceae bacterium]|nr:amidase family protein [Ilumatobacteraceae bacterium]